MKRIWRALRGRERLMIVFWAYCVVGGIVATVLPFIVAEPLYDRGFPMWFFTLLAVVQSLYLLWVHVSVWTCAFNSSRRVWGYLARGYVCAVVVMLAVQTLMPPPKTDIEVLKIGNAQQTLARDVRNARA
jgi:hypothetical protein